MFAYLHLFVCEVNSSKTYFTIFSNLFSRRHLVLHGHSYWYSWNSSEKNRNIFFSWKPFNLFNCNQSSDCMSSFQLKKILRIFFKRKISSASSGLTVENYIEPKKQIKKNCELCFRVVNFHTNKCRQIIRSNHVE